MKGLLSEQGAQNLSEFARQPWPLCKLQRRTGSGWVKCKTCLDVAINFFSVKAEYRRDNDAIAIDSGDLPFI